VEFINEATRCLGVWMEAHLMFKEHHKRGMKQARVTESRLGALTRMPGIVQERVQVVLTACVQAIVQY
jgi:hypothetical protein